MTLNLAIGLFTPPFGINIFVAQSALGINTGDIYRGVAPFLLIFLIALSAVTFIPSISLISADFFMFGK
jgi:C4-dicarboxylate transporter DctM subunit